VEDSRSQAAGGARKKRWWTRWRLFALAAVINIFLARAFWPVGRPEPTYSRETTWYDGPVNFDGTVDYAAALDARLGEGVTRETNAAVEFVRLFGPSSLRGDNASGTLERLGLEGLPDEGAYLRPLIIFIREWVEAHPTDEELALPEQTEQSRAWDGIARRLVKKGSVSIDGDAVQRLKGGQTRRRARSRRSSDIFVRVTGSPWSTEKYPFLAAYLDEHAADLERLAALARLPNWYVPIVSAHTPAWLSDRTMVSYLSLKGAADLLCARVMRCLHDGDIDAAWEDALTCHRLARLVATDAQLFALMAGIGIEDVALHVDAAICVQAGLSPERARRYGEELAGMAPLRPIVEVLDCGERCGTLDIAAMTYRTKEFALDHDLMMRRINATFDALVEAARLPPAAGRPAYEGISDRFCSERDALTARYKGWSGRFRSLLLSSWQRRKLTSIVLSDVAMSVHLPAYTCVDAYVSTEVERSLVRAAFAVAAYRAKQGWFPPNAEALVPGYIAEWPADPFAGAPARWHDEAGTFTLYSVGPDGAEDGGDEEKDIVVVVH